MEEKERVARGVALPTDKVGEGVPREELVPEIEVLGVGRELTLKPFDCEALGEREGEVEPLADALPLK